MGEHERVARQMEAALAKVSSPLDVIMLVDGSSSVNANQFEIMRLCIRQFVDMFPAHQEGGVRIGLVQFDSSIKIECNLDSNMQRVNCAITAMIQTRGGTNAYEAFEAAKFMFSKWHRSAMKLIIFLTDGDCGDAVVTASAMRDTEGTHIVAIGVNMSDATDLAKIASNNSYFLFNSFEHLRQVFTYLNRTVTSPPKIDINSRGSHSATLQILLPPEVTKIKEWEVVSFGFNTNKWEKLGSSQADIMCLHDLHANVVYKLKGRALMLNDAWSDYSPDLEFRTMIENALAPILRNPSSREAECKRLVEFISQQKPNSRLRKAGVSKYNVLFLGRMGAGKSSTLDSMASAIDGQYKAIAPFRASAETVTQTLQMYTMTRSKSREPQVCIGDVYGWSETNYKNSELGFILDGNVKSGYTETVSGFLPGKANPFYKAAPTYNEKIHSVVVVVSAISVGTQTEMVKLNEFYKFLNTKGYQPIFVLTKVDRLPDPVLIGHNENVLDSGVVDATVDNFCELSAIPKHSVFPIINYQGPYTQGPDFVIEMLVLTVLKTALQQAETFLEKNEDQIVKFAKAASKNSKGSKKAKEESESESESASESESDSDREKVSDDSEEERATKKKGRRSPKTSPTKTKKAPPSPALAPAPPSPALAPASPSAIMNLTEAAAYLSVEENDILELLETKEINGKRIGSNWRIPKEAIDKYLNS